MPSFIAVTQLLLSQPMNFSAHPHNSIVEIVSSKLVHIVSCNLFENQNGVIATPLRTRKSLMLYNVYGISDLLSLSSSGVRRPSVQNQQYPCFDSTKHNGKINNALS